MLTCWQGRKETDLFDRIRNSSKTGDAKKKTATDKKRREKAIKEAINTAVELFGEVKDVRDELDILQWIATYQRSVQKKLFKKDVPEPDLIASHVLKDISLMEQRASRIQEAVGPHARYLNFKNINKITLGQLNTFLAARYNSEHRGRRIYEAKQCPRGIYSMHCYFCEYCQLQMYLLNY